LIFDIWCDLRELSKITKMRGLIHLALGPTAPKLFLGLPARQAPRDASNADRCSRFRHPLSLTLPTSSEGPILAPRALSPKVDLSPSTLHIMAVYWHQLRALPAHPPHTLLLREVIYLIKRVDGKLASSFGVVWVPFSEVHLPYAPRRF
jgi:hypothetical protein